MDGYSAQLRKNDSEEDSGPIQARPPSRRRPSARISRAISTGNINPLIGGPITSPRPPGSSAAARANLSTGLMRPDQVSRGSLVIKAMKEKLASQRGGIKASSTRTASSRGQVNRLVQDKRYYMGTLHLKIGELTDEIDRLNRLYNEASVEYGNSLVYEKRVKELAAEITEMQGRLTDLNIVADNMTFDNIQSIKNETKELKESNDAMTERIESIFADRLRKEESVQEVEKKLNQERHRNERLLSELGPEMREMNNNLLLSLKKVENWQQEIEALNKKKILLNEQIYMHPTTYKAMRLESKLFELKKKWKNVKKTSPTQSAEDERKSIMGRVVSDNSQINMMESAIVEINKEIKNAEEILAMTTKESEEGRDNRQLMYNELQKKEEVIENFLSNYESSKQSLNDKLKTIEDDLLNTLKQLSQKLALTPTPADYRFIQVDQSNEQVDVLNTLKSICAKCESLRQYLKKIEIMQTKLTEEEEMLESKMKQINEELIEYSSCTKLNKNIEKKENELNQIKLDIEKNRDQIKEALKTAKSLHDETLKELHENEHQLQLFSLEKKLSNIGQNNFTMTELIEDIKISTNVKEHRTKAVDILQNLNMFLRNNLNHS